MDEGRYSRLCVSLKLILVRSRIAMGAQDSPDIDFIKTQADEFALHIDADMPEARLEEVYRRAMQMKSEPYGLTVVDLNLAWREIKGNEYKPHIYQCPGCKLVKSGERASCPFHKNNVVPFESN